MSTIRHHKPTRTRIVGLAVGITLIPAVTALDHSLSASAASVLRDSLAKVTRAITWRATLIPPQSNSEAVAAEKVGGTAMLTSAGPKETRAAIHVANAIPGSVHPWHLHRGTCGKDKGIVGPASVYTPLHIGADGEGEITQTLPYATPTKGQYMVNVHKSAVDMKTIVSCGQLKREPE